MKPLLLGIVLVAAMIVLAVSGASEPQNQPAPEPDVQPPSVDARFEQADGLMDEEKHVEALALYQQLLTELPVSAKAQKAAIKAGLCLDALERHHEAIAIYGRAVAMGDQLCSADYSNPEGRDETSPRPRASGARLVSIKDWTERALYGKALACQRAGQFDEGLKTVLFLRAWAPNSRFVMELLPLKLQFEGKPTELLSEMARREGDAAALCEEGHEAFWTGRHDDAIPLLERVISEYPDSAAALRARVDLARILWGRSEYEQAAQLFLGILEEIGSVAPNSDYARLAKYRVAWKDMTDSTLAAQFGVRFGRAVSSEEWERVREASRVVMALSPEQSERADAHSTVVATYTWEGRHEDALREAKYFFRNYRSTSGRKDAAFAGQVAWVHLYAGICLEETARPAEAAIHYNAILQWDADHPGTLGAEKTVVERAAARLNRFIIR